MNSSLIISKINLYGRTSLMRSIPWFVDDSIDFIKNYALCFFEENNKEPEVLEFGMGAGTLFFISHSSHVTSIEHNKEWFDKITSLAEMNNVSNLTPILSDIPYTKEIDALSGRKFNIISIDGRDRVQSLGKCIESDLLAKNGIFVLDNTERISGYEQIYAPMLEALGDFNMIHFEQLGVDKTGWLAPHRWLTTIAFRKSERQYTTKGVVL